jgi:hypothetical protein
MELDNVLNVFPLHLNTGRFSGRFGDFDRELKE